MFELIKKLKSKEIIKNFINVQNKWLVDINVGFF